MEILPGTLRALLKGGKPTLDTLLQISSRSGVEIKWLASGEGPQYIATTAISPAASTPIDPDLLGGIVDRIMRIYQEERVELKPGELGRVAAEQYREIRQLGEDPEEWPALIDLMTVRLRRAIRSSGRKQRS